METCQVCDRELKQKVYDSVMCCANCRWPVSFAIGNADPINQFALRWAKSMYRQYYELKISQTTVSPSAKTAQISGDDTLEKLANRMLVVEESLHRFDGLSQSVQVAKDAIDQNRQLAKKIEAIEVWCRSAHQDIITLQQQPTPAAKIESADSFGDMAATEMLQSAFSLAPAEQELVDLYNQFHDLPDELLNMAQDVSLEEGTVDRLRNGDTSRTLFVAKQKGIFLVVNRNGCWYLLPHKKRPITDLIHRTVKFVYSCHSYHEDYEQLVLLKPALLQEVGDNQWQLSRAGDLKFV
jgi:hypothetical protein